MNRLLLLLVVAVGLGAGTNPLRADTVPHRLFTAFDGLPSENVTALAQAPSGLLWIGTGTGVAVYDGQELRRVELPDSIGTPYVSAIEVLSDGSAWVTTSGGTAVQMRSTGVERVVELGDRIVQQILTRKDTLLFVTRAAVWHLAPGEEVRRQRYGYDFRPSEEVSDEVGAGIFNAGIGPEGTVWVLDGHLGPGRLRDDGSVSFVGAPSKAPGNFWYDIQFADDGTGLVLQGEKLHRLDPKSGALETVFEELGDPTYLSVQGNRAYVTREQTLLRYDVDTGRSVSSLGAPQGLPEHVPVKVLHDQEGGLWIGTKEGLLHLMAPETRTVEAVEERPLLNVVQFLDHGPALWALTYGAGLIQLRPTRRFSAPDDLVGWRQRVKGGDDRLHAIATETRDWYRWSGEGDWTRVTDTEGAEEGVVGPDGHGYFLHDEGLYRHSSEGATPPTQLASWPSNETHAHDLALFSNGDLLHRAEDVLLRRRRHDGEVLDTVGVLSEAGTRNISQMVVDSDGRIWCAYRYGGLHRVVPDTDEQRILLEEVPFWGIEVVHDRLLIGSTRQEGAFLIDPRTGTVRRQLTRADGLRSNTVLTSHFAADTLYLGHDNGITRIPDEQLEKRPSAPSTLLTGVEVDFEDRSPAATDSVFSPTERSVGFAYGAPSLARANRVQYEVRLLPRDTTWEATSRRFTRYTSLAPGTYRFEARARLSNQQPGAVAAYSFTIPPQFYETRWFRILMGMLLVGFGIIAYRARTYRLRKRQETLQAAVAKRTRELEERTRELAEEKEKTERQAERLAELDEAKNRFFAHISHEFRTPLSLILSPLRDALQRAVDGTATVGTRQLRRMTKNAERLRRLIDQLLDLATLEAGRMELERRPGDVGRVITRTVEAFRSKAEQKGIDLQVSGLEGGGQAWFDPEKVETMVRNLVSNAVKFTPEGGQITVRVRRGTGPGGAEANGPVDTSSWEGVDRLENAPVAGAEEQEGVWIEVEDTGPGIAPAAQDQIFERFEQSTPPLEGDGREHKGTGLGLALTRELAELHGGTIEVKSTPGEGATFAVWLPLVPVVETATGETRGERGEGRETGGERRNAKDEGQAPGEEEAATVLVVEDNAEMRSYLREELAGQWTVLEASDGEEGWRTVREEQPDLVLSDVMMPGLSGVALCERIKQEEALRQIPVILLTARVGEEATLEGLESGADDYVEKPFGTEELRKRIANQLAARRHLQARYRQEVTVESLGVVADEEARPFVEAVIETAEEHLGNPDFTVGRLAEEMALSRRQLTRRLKKAMGETPGTVLRRLRIERAKRHLRAGTETVSEVAYATGFRSPSAFSQSFQNLVGQTPTEYAEKGAE